MRSAFGVEEQAGAVRLHGQRAPAALGTDGAAGGGVALVPASSALRPGETIAVVAPSAEVRKRMVPALVYVLAVSVGFAALGVVLALWVMLGPTVAPQDPNATATATAPAEPAPLTDVSGHSPGHSHSSAPLAPATLRAPARSAAPALGILPAPAPQTPAGAPAHHHQPH